MQATWMQDMMGNVPRRHKVTVYGWRQECHPARSILWSALEILSGTREIVQIGFPENRNLKGNKCWQRKEGRLLEEIIDKEYTTAKLFYQKLIKLISNISWLLILESGTMLCHLIQMTNLWIGFYNIYSLDKDTEAQRGPTTCLKLHS